MAYAWVDQPLDPPHVCPFTRSGAPDVGPFVQTPLAYLTPVQDEQGEMRIVPVINTLYLSAQAIREMCAEPGSPLVAVDRTKHDALATNEARLSIELDAAEQRIRELESALEIAESHQNAVDVEALASALVVPLRSHFAAKSGPKPKAAA